MGRKIYFIYSNKFFYFVIIFIILFGTLLRVCYLESLSEFSHDNVRELINVWKLYKYKEWIFRGPVYSQAWGFLSPVYYYILFPVFYFSNFHPIAPAVFSIVINIFSLILLAITTYRSHGKKVSIIATLIYSLSFVITYWGAYGLNPNFEPPFAILLYYSLIKLFRGEERYLKLFSFSLALLLNFHASGFFILPTIVLLYFFYKPKFKKNTIIYSFFIFFVIAILPYLIEEWKFDFWNFKQLSSFFVDEGGQKENGFIINYLNFWYASLKNISLILFNRVNFFSLVVSVVFLLFLVKDTLLIYRNKYKFESLLGFTILTYLITFGALVHFKASDPYEWFFYTIFYPFIVIYISLKLSSFKAPGFNFALILFSFIFIAINVRSFFQYNPPVDKYSETKKITDFIRKDSKGENIDIYGADPRPFYYMLWYYETDSSSKDKYYIWVKWGKNKDAKIVYYLDNKNGLDLEKSLSEISSGHQVERVSDVYSTVSAKVYRID